MPSDVFVTVEAVAGQGPAASAAVTRAGGQVRTVYRELVDAVIPLAAIPTVAQDPSVLRIDLPLPPVATVVGQGVGLIGASRWQDGGLNGSGVRVGIVDLGFQGYALRLGGDLPGSVQTVCSPEALQNGQPHGTAVAEIVHSIAPAAELYLVNAQTTAEVGDAIACLASHGVSVINHSVGWAYAGPGDGHRAAIDAIVDDAVNRGILWVNSSGNQAEKHWAGLWSDPDGNGWLNFPDGGELLPVWLDAGHPLNAFLRWNDPWGGACNDYDLYLYDAAIVVRAGSENAQVCSPSSVPREALAYTASSSGWHYLAIRRHAASSLSRFDLITSNQDLPVIDQVAANSLLHPADSANPGMVSVGAVPWYSPAVLEPFSSQGPTTDGRIKPDLVAPDGVANAVFGAFAGTSAAAPHVAGAAALLKQANPDLSPAGLASLLRERIVDLGSLGPDSRFGTGRLSLGAPPSTSTPTPTSTASRTATATLTATQSATPMSTATATATALATPATTGTPTPTPSSTPSPTPATGGPAPTRTSGRGSSDHVRVFIPLAVR